MCKDALEDAGDETKLFGILGSVHNARVARDIISLSVLVWSLHGESLTRSGLPVCYQAAMVALQERVRDGNANTLEDVRLAGVMVIHVIVTVGGVALGRNLNGLSACVNALDISLRRSERVAEGEHMERFGTFLFYLGGRHSPGLALASSEAERARELEYYDLRHPGQCARRARYPYRRPCVLPNFRCVPAKTLRDMRFGSFPRLCPTVETAYSYIFLAIEPKFFPPVSIYSPSSTES